MKTPWIHRLYRAGTGTETFAAWFGGLLTLAAAWPLYYAAARSYGRTDWEAIGAGIIGVSTGLSLFLWGIRGRRAPKYSVLVDLRARDGQR